MSTIHKSLKGTVYIRDNEWFKLENVFKLGIASYAKDRSSTYITSEVKRGEYVCVIEVPLNKMKILDTCLKNYFKQFHIYHDGATELYDRCIINLIVPYLQNLNIDIRVLSIEEINTMNRCERLVNNLNIIRIKKLFTKDKIKNITRYYKNKNSNIIIPNEHQQIVLNNINVYYKYNNIGKIIWACGLGKALLAVLIVKQMQFKTIVIGVPSNNLQKQMKKEILMVFANENNILFVGCEGHGSSKSTTDAENIINFINNKQNNEPIFIISTYHSSRLLVNKKLIFDFKIGDEAHHLVGIEKDECKGFTAFHKITSKKTLFMTATEKIINKDIKNTLYSMDDEKKFGKHIDEKSVQWAIENKKITDYNILIIKNNEKEVDEICNNLGLSVYNKELFISCYMSLKSFEKYDNLTHLLLYTNTTQDADLAKKYIDDLLTLKIIDIKKEDIYNKSLHSKSSIILEKEIEMFENSPRGIISCVYIFGEGFNLPKLNGVCIATNMKSEIRIVQYVLRPNRLEKNNPNKKAYIIIPFIDCRNEDIDVKKKYDKIINVISQIRNIDKNIYQKIIVSTGIKKIEKGIIKPIYIDDYYYKDNDGELCKIKLRLKYSNSLYSDFTEEQDEYNYVKSLNKILKISGMGEYIASEKIHDNYIDKPEEYFKSKGVWNGLYDFMGLNTDNLIQSKDDWVIYCKKINIYSLESYYKSCKEYDILPKEPADFYKNFSNIPIELGFNRHRRN
jgi:predicted helicase